MKILSSAWFVLSKPCSEFSYLPSIHVFQQWDSFWSQKLSMILSLSSWSTFCSHSFTCPLLLNSFLWSTSPWLLQNSQLFLLCHYLVLWNMTWGFPSHFLPHPHFVCLFSSELVLLKMSSLLIAVSFSCSLIHLLVLGDCYIIFVIPRNYLIQVWTVETHLLFYQGYLLHMQDEIHLFSGELSAVS